MPSVQYLAELGTTHLGHDLLMRGSRGAVRAVTADLPPELSAGYNTWHMPGHLGEIGKTALVLEHETVPPSQDRLRALHRGAVFMTFLGVTDTVAGTNRPDRTPENTDAFFRNVQDALLQGDPELPQVLPDGPAQQQDAYTYAHRVGRWLRLKSAQKDQLSELFADLRRVWVGQLTESAGDRDPQRLLHLAEEIGVLSTQMGSVVVTGSVGHEALKGLGAIGGRAQPQGY
jgi:hypothetical protein